MINFRQAKEEGEVHPTNLGTETSNMTEEEAVITIEVVAITIEEEAMITFEVVETLTETGRTTDAEASIGGGDNDHQWNNNPKFKCKNDRY